MNLALLHHLQSVDVAYAETSHNKLRDFLNLWQTKFYTCTYEVSSFSSALRIPSCCNQSNVHCSVTTLCKGLYSHIHSLVYYCIKGVSTFVGW